MCLGSSIGCFVFTEALNKLVARQISNLLDMGSADILIKQFKSDTVQPMMSMICFP